MGGPVVHEQNSLLIQPDWNEIADGGKFFIGCRKYGEPSQYINLVKFSSGIETGINGTSVKILSERKLEVNCDNYASKLFVAPSVTLDKLHSSAITSIDLSSSGNLIVSAESSGILKLWSARYGTTLCELEGHIMDINRCRFFPSDLFVVSCGLDMALKIWCVNDDKLTSPFLLNGHTRVTDFAIVEDGNYILSGSKDKKCVLYDVALQKILHTWELENEIYCIDCVMRDESKVVICGLVDGQVAILDIAEKEKICTLKISEHPITALHINNGICYCGDDKGEVYCFAITDCRMISVLKTVNAKVTKLVKSSVGLITSFADGVLGIFEDPNKNANLSVEFTGADVDPIYDFVYSEQDGVLFSACRDEIVRKYHFK